MKTNPIITSIIHRKNEKINKIKIKSCYINWLSNAIKRPGRIYTGTKTPRKIQNTKSFQPKIIWVRKKKRAKRFFDLIYARRKFTFYFCVRRNKSEIPQMIQIFTSRPLGAGRYTNYIVCVC